MRRIHTLRLLLLLSGVAVVGVAGEVRGPADVAAAMARLPAEVVVGGLHQTYDGTPRFVSVRTSPADLPVRVTYNGTDVAPIDAGAYTVVASVSDARYEATATATLVVGKAPAVLALGALAQPYEGVERAVTYATIPANLPVHVLYDGMAEPPILPGRYGVTATVEHPNYVAGEAKTLVVTITALTRHAPIVRGAIDGSMQLAAPDNITFGRRAWLSGDLLVPGTPALQLLGLPMIAGSYDGDGRSAPSDRSVVLEGNAVLRYLVRRVDPLGLPVVAAPAPGAPLTRRDIAIAGADEPVVLPAGAYHRLSVAAGATLVLGVAAQDAPPITYDFDSITVAPGATIRVAGPIGVTVAGSVNIGGTAGNAAHPEWLALAVAGPAVTLEDAAQLDALLDAPNATVMLQTGATLRGEVVSDTLLIDEGALLREPFR